MITLLIICLIRALIFKPKAKDDAAPEAVAFDREKAVNDLRELVRIKTVSYNDTKDEDAEEFEKLRGKLKELFPNVHTAADLERIPPKGLLYRWKGRSSDKPTVLMAHYDVVPADESQWSRPAFEGIIEGDVLWGRGTLDTKGTLNGILQAAEKLIGEGFVPENDVYFAFAGDEETAGESAPNIVSELERRGIVPALVVDEGGAVVENVFPGVKKRCAVIGIAEKGITNIRYTVLSNGGHASTPPRHTPVGILSAACNKVENNPFPAKLSAPVLKMFDALGRHSTFVYRLIFANLWLFKPLLAAMGAKSGGEMNALMRTTCAFTMMEGSDVYNVIPAKATMTSNLRIISGETIASTVDYLKNVIDDELVKIEVINGSEPSVVSVTDCEGYAKLEKTVSEVFPDAIVSPYLMIACSDSRHYGRISDKVYRFSAMAMSGEERKMIHGNDERITFRAIWEAVEFYIRLIKKC